MWSKMKTRLVMVLVVLLAFYAATSGAPRVVLGELYDGGF
jgi:hypothetical protein